MTQPSIFDLELPNSADPAWFAAPLTSLEQRFKAFHEANPHVYTALAGRAQYESLHGATRLSIAKLAEQLRADIAVNTTGDEFRINNSFRALYARLLMHRLPMLAGKFEVRERRERCTAMEGQ